MVKRKGMKVLILTEGGKNIGFGHLTRCIGLYQGFREKGICSQIIVCGDKTVVSLLCGTNFRFFNWLKNKEVIFDIIKGMNIVIVDSYLAKLDFYEKLSNIAKVPVYFDDDKRFEYPKGIVINSNVYADSLPYPMDNGVEYILGPRYVSLRKDFWNILPRKIREKIYTIMLSLGGNDMRNLTPLIIKILLENFSKYNVKVVIGRGFQNVNEIKKIVGNRGKVNLIYDPSPVMLRKTMMDSDIAISGGGQTLYELARVGLPAIAIGLAENQQKNIKYWQEIGFLEYGGDWHDDNIYDNICLLINKFNSYDKRKKSSDVGKRLVDGRGSLRIVNFLKRKCF
jgi:spore coat polysaccharide biosynthesis predicted glycosyltransferase SpsG